MRVIWSREAQQQLDAIWLYLADRSVALADRVEARLQDRAASLAAAPFQGRPLPGADRRRLPIRDVSYVVVYRIEDDLVRILRLWHMAQDRDE